MKKFLLVAFLLSGCANKRMAGIDMDNLSGTPCVDGIVYNIEQAGCKVLYWGQTASAGVKLRCSYADHASFYTKASFYAMALGKEPVLSQPYMPWCADTQIIVYAALPQNETETENN